MKFTLALALFIGFFSIQPARAELLLEPVLGYNVGSKLKLSDEDFSGSGVGYGGRIGFQKLGFQIGLDYLSSTIAIDDDSFDDDLQMEEWAAFVGYELPILLRVYAGYIFSATADSKDDLLGKHEFSEGSGAKFGLGFTGLPIIDINVEYRSGTFGKYEVGGAEGAGGDPKYSSILLALSAPFTF